MKLVAVLVVVVAVIGASIFLMNHSRLQSKVENQLKADARNEGIGVSVHYASVFNHSRLVFDLRRVSETRAPIDVFRVLLQSAAVLKEERFERVELAFRGRTKFFVDGAYFQTLGQEYEDQNPVYTARTFCEHLLLPGGAAAYGTWTGGLLGVVKEQMEDFNDFHQTWYLTDMAAAR